MDGFLANEGVVVLGATNRSEDLDKALLRPGRFDTQVVVPIPDMKGRREILVLYLVSMRSLNSQCLDTEPSIRNWDTLVPILALSENGTKLFGFQMLD